MRVNRGCTPGQMVRHIIGTRGNEAYTAFAWSNRGRAAYKAQWGFIRSTADGLATIRAGHDALRHSANAPWFEWLEGSASFFGTGVWSISEDCKIGNHIMSRVLSPSSCNRRRGPRFQQSTS